VARKNSLRRIWKIAAAPVSHCGALDGVCGIERDRILRRYLDLIKAT